MVACNVLFSNSEFVNMCLGSREWENKDGYVNNDLYLPKLTKAGVPIEAVGVEPSRLVIYNSDDTNHLRRVIKKVSPTTNNFEPAKTTGDDFDL